MNKQKNNQNNMPLVSVVIPTYNAEKYLAEAIDSILWQTYQNYELYIVDDASTDGTVDIIKQYQKKYPKKVKAIFLKENTNAAGNAGMNIAYPLLKGKYIVRMDADDIAYPKRIEKQVKFMEKHPDAILLGTQGTVIDGQGKVIGDKKFPISNQAIYKEYFILHPILHPSVMFRKSLIPNKDYIYENKWGVNDDYYTFFNLLQYGKFYNLPESLLYYRVHGSNSSLQNLKQKFINTLNIRFQAIKKFNYKPSIKGIILMLAQCLLIGLIPEKLVLPVYFFIKGVRNSEKSNFNLNPKVAVSVRTS